MKTRNQYELLARKYNSIEPYKCFLYFKKMFSRKSIIIVMLILLILSVSVWCLVKYGYPRNEFVFVMFSLVFLIDIMFVFMFIVVPIFSALILPILVYITAVLYVLFWSIHCVVLDLAEFLDLDKEGDLRKPSKKV